MHPDTGTTIVIVVLIVIVFALLVTRGHPKHHNDQGSPSPMSGGGGSAPVPPSNGAAASSSTVSITEPLSKQEESRVSRRESLKQRFRQQMRDQTGHGADFNDALDQALAGTEGGLSLEDGLREAAQIGYDRKAVALALFKRGESLGDIAVSVNDIYDPSFNDLFETILSLTDQAIPMDDRAVSVIKAVGNIGNWTEDEYPEVAKFLLAKGCSTERAASVLYDENLVDADFASVVTSLNIGADPAAIAAAARELDIDLADENDYDDLRNNNVDLAVLVQAMKIRGKSVKDILDAEYGYDSSGIDDYFKEIVEYFRQAGFTQKEIVAGVWDSDYLENDDAGETVVKLHELGMPFEEIVAVLKNTDNDPDELYDELKDAGLDIKERIRLMSIMVGLSGPEKTEAAKAEKAA